MLGKTIIADRKKAIEKSNRTLVEKHHAERELRLKLERDFGHRITIASCSDGRVGPFDECIGLPTLWATNFRNIGGKFNLGWREFTDEVTANFKKNVDEGFSNLFMSTYHYSDKHEDLCCAGFNGKIEATKAHFTDFVKKAKELWSPLAYPFKLGFNTDNGTAIFHGEKHEVSISKMLYADAKQVREAMKEAFPEASEKLIALLQYMFTKNREVSNQKQDWFLDNYQHTESVLGIGRGSVVVGLPYEMLSIGGTFGHDVTKPIKKALTIIKQNINAGRVDINKGIVLLSLAEYHPFDRINTMQAEAESRLLADVLLHESIALFPDLEEYFVVLPAIVNREEKEISFLPYKYRDGVKKAHKKIKLHKELASVAVSEN